MAIRFPKENVLHENVFLMIPTKFKIRAQKSLSEQYNMKIPISDGAIVLPTPSSGLSLSEAGNWDESEGYQHALTQSGATDAAIKATLKGVKDALGAAGNAAFRGEFINDYASLAYQGSNFREFTFSWDLIPKSLEDAKIIQQIIQTIRYYSLPSYGGITTKRARVAFPYMWEVKPVLGNLDKTFIIKDAVITNFTTNYTPDGVLKTYNSNHPLSVNIEVSFKELYRATRADSGYTK